ncbi:hypothetical protein LTS08_004422 [Lithohypha guttulata]|nr:hypothetical protein LTS08_004422 [Lithohypha guttulata]
MGRTKPSLGAPPAAYRKDARAKRARQTSNKDIPALLQAYPRAKKGVESSELIVNPPPVNSTNQKVPPKHENDAQADPSTIDDSEAPTTPAVKVNVCVADTFQAAADFAQASQSPSLKRGKLAVLNMASPLRAGGGFLNGATAQEETLCMRSTLYPSLRDDFYRLPEVGGIWTPDVLVFRSHHEGAPDLPKNDRFFVNVISSAMLRFPDLEEDDEGEKCYAEPEDRKIAEQKIRAVMRIAKSKGAKRLVLSAWGCGAFKNPVGETARIWKKVLLGGKSSGKASAVEEWGDMDIVFAIKERAMADTFARNFGVDLVVPTDDGPDGDQAGKSGDHDEDGATELQAKIGELEAQIASARDPGLKNRLTTIVTKLRNDEDGR